MSKPPAEPDDWSGAAEALFDSARRAHAPSAVDRERVRSALGQKLAAAAGVQTSGSDGPSGLSGAGMSRAWLSKLAKIGVGAACALVFASAFMRAGEPRERTEVKRPTVQSSSVQVQRPQRAAEIAVAVRNEPASATAANLAQSTAAHARAQNPVPAHTLRRPVGPAQPAGASRAKPALPAAAARAPERSQPCGAQAAPAACVRRSSPPSAARSDGAEDTSELYANTNDARAELELVARINAAVRGSSPQTVLALCAEHERRWPHGVFEQEREGTRAITWCSAKALGAGARAQAFLTRYPRSAIAARVREECAAPLSAAANERD